MISDWLQIPNANYYGTICLKVLGADDGSRTKNSGGRRTQRIDNVILSGGSFYNECFIARTPRRNAHGIQSNNATSLYFEI